MYKKKERKKEKRRKKIKNIGYDILIKKIYQFSLYSKKSINYKLIDYIVHCYI